MDFDTAPIPRFNCGLDLSSLVVSSDLLHHSWNAISELHTDPRRNLGSSPAFLRYRETQVRNYRLIAFSASAKHLHGGGDLIPSSDVPEFRFICSKSNPDFSIDRAAMSLFDSARQDLSTLKAQVQDGAKSTAYLITGHSLGGSIASLFTLWLLDSLNPVTTKRPLCITYGSPLLGDCGFQQAISQYPAWNSCFLHAVHKDDHIPTISPQTTYRPFGSYLFLSSSGMACFEAPTSSELLERTKPERRDNMELVDFDYGPTVKYLRHNYVCKDTMKLSGRETDSYKAGIVLQLTAIGVLQNEQQQQHDSALMKWVDRSIVEPERMAITQKMETFNSAKKLNEVKVNMARMEWYRKTSENEGYYYYDDYKSKRLTRDYSVVMFKRTLTDYWEKLVKEVEKKPQKEEANMRNRWLYAGTNFRRMVEPLDIAEYYKVEGNEDYWTRGRLNCYRKLEKWLEEARRPEVNLATRKQNIKLSLTGDSCFWAHVEEAMKSCEAYNNGDRGRSVKRLEEFQGYVYGLVESHSVSPEIFIGKSSFMKWWKVYDEMDLKTDSKLVWFMRNRMYYKYGEGRYDPMEDEE